MHEKIQAPLTKHEKLLGPIPCLSPLSSPTHPRMYIQRIFYKFPPPAHDCRAHVIQQHCETQDYRALILSEGVRETYNTVTKMHAITKKDSENPADNK